MQVSSLLDETIYDEFTESIAEEYEEVREDHYETIQVGSNISL